MFYAKPSSQIEVVIFHDADTLDFMGYIGITRILSIVGLDDWTPDLKTAVTLIRRFSKQLPKSLHTPQAQEIGKARQAEMQTYIKALSDETSRFKVL